MVGSHTYMVVSLEPGSRGVARNVVISVNAVMRVKIGRHKRDYHILSSGTQQESPDLLGVK